MATKDIQHLAKVVSIEGDKVVVGFRAQGACASCHSRSVCGMTESADKLIDVHTPLASTYSVGEDVVVSMTQTMGTKAVMLAYVAPLIVLLVSIFTLLAFGLNEGISAVASIIVTAIYFFLIYAYRNRFEKQIKFIITKQ